MVAENCFHHKAEPWPDRLNLECGGAIVVYKNGCGGTATAVVLGSDLVQEVRNRHIQGRCSCDKTDDFGYMPRGTNEALRHYIL